MALIYPVHSGLTYMESDGAEMVIHALGSPNKNALNKRQLTKWRVKNGMYIYNNIIACSDIPIPH